MQSFGNATGQTLELQGRMFFAASFVCFSLQYMRRRQYMQAMLSLFIEVLAKVRKQLLNPSLVLYQDTLYTFASSRRSGLCFPATCCVAPALFRTPCLWLHARTVRAHFGRLGSSRCSLAFVARPCCMPHFVPRNRGPRPTCADREFDQSQTMMARMLMSGRLVTSEDGICFPAWMACRARKGCAARRARGVRGLRGL